MILYRHQEIIQTNIDAVVDMLRSDFITQRPVVPKFDKAGADYTGAKYGIAVNSGASAKSLANTSSDKFKLNTSKLYI